MARGHDVEQASALESPVGNRQVEDERTVAVPATPGSPSRVTIDGLGQAGDWRSRTFRVPSGVRSPGEPVTPVTTSPESGADPGRAEATDSATSV